MGFFSFSFLYAGGLALMFIKKETLGSKFAICLSCLMWIIYGY